MGVDSAALTCRQQGREVSISNEISVQEILSEFVLDYYVSSSRHRLRELTLNLINERSLKGVPDLGLSSYQFELGPSRRVRIRVG